MDYLFSVRSNVLWDYGFYGQNFMVGVFYFCSKRGDVSRTSLSASNDFDGNGFNILSIASCLNLGNVINGLIEIFLFLR